MVEREKQFQQPKIPSFHRVITEAKELIRTSGGLILSQKRLKAMYAHLQSRFREYFLSPWDGMFFGLASSQLEDATSSFNSSLSGIEGILWAEPTSRIEPIHHGYKQSFSKNNCLIETYLDKVNETTKKEIQAEILAFNLFSPPVATHWLFLLEALTDLKLRKEDNIGLKKHYTSAYNEKLNNSGSELEKELGDNGFSPLLVSLYDIRKSYVQEGLKLFNSLPYEMNKTEMEIVKKFYETYKYERGLSFNWGDNLEECMLQAFYKKAKKNYDYLSLKDKKKLSDEKDVLRNSIDYEDALKKQDETHLQRIIGNNGNGNKCNYDFIRNRLEERENVIANTIDLEIKQMALERAKKYINILEKYDDIATNRFEDIIDTISVLCKVSNNEPIKVSFIKDTDSSPRSCTLVCLELTPEFEKEYKEKRQDECHAGSYWHLYHLFQPAEVCATVKQKQEQTLIEGGVIEII